MVGPEGLEPSTCRLWGGCTIETYSRKPKKSNELPQRGRASLLQPSLCRTWSGPAGRDDWSKLKSGKQFSRPNFRTMAEQSHEAARLMKRGMRRFKSVRRAQRFVTSHAAVSNLFNLGRHLVRAQHYRDLRMSAFNNSSRAVAWYPIPLLAEPEKLICRYLELS